MSGLEGYLACTLKEAQKIMSGSVVRAKAWTGAQRGEYIFFCDDRRDSILRAMSKEPGYCTQAADGYTNWEVLQVVLPLGKMLDFPRWQFDTPAAAWEEGRPVQVPPGMVPLQGFVAA